MRNVDKIKHRDKSARIGRQSPGVTRAVGTKAWPSCFHSVRGFLARMVSILAIWSVSMFCICCVWTSSWAFICCWSDWTWAVLCWWWSFTVVSRAVCRLENCLKWASSIWSLWSWSSASILSWGGNLARMLCSRRCSNSCSTCCTGGPDGAAGTLETAFDQGSLVNQGSVPLPSGWRHISSVLAWPTKVAAGSAGLDFISGHVMTIWPCCKDRTLLGGSATAWTLHIRPPVTCWMGCKGRQSHPLAFKVLAMLLRSLKTLGIN